jgi:transcriptional antiterminator RfaH
MSFLKKPIEELHWYAVYTRSRCEKKVVSDIQDFFNTEAWLPLQKTIRQWSDRKKWVDVPLFNSYIFVHTTSAKVRDLVAQTTGAVYVVSFEGKPTAVPDDQIESLKLLLSTSANIEVSIDTFAIGEPVEVYRGPMRGFKGKLVSYKGSKRVMLHIEALNQTLLIEINPANLKKLTEKAVLAG